MHTYENISDEYERLGDAEIQGTHSIAWMHEHLLAIGKNPNGQHAVFILGEELLASRPNLARYIRFSRWKADDGTDFEANLISLPGEVHFRAAASTIVVELLRNGLGKRDTASVFREVEPLIDLVITRFLLPPESALGLLGELVVLEQLLAVSPLPEWLKEDPTQVWHGWQRKSRDFSLGRIGIEVKATSTDSPHHHIHSLSQIESRELDGGSSEVLYLASIGLRPVAHGSISLAMLTERILQSLSGDARNRFLSRVAQYGPAECVGYQHEEMRELEQYTQAYTMTYAPRLYEMNDPNMMLIRRQDLVGTFVCEKGIQYSVLLPESVPGSINNPEIAFGPALRQLMNTARSLENR